MTQRVVLLMGLPASGKSSLVARLTLSPDAPKFTSTSRDLTGGKVVDLLPGFAASLANGESVVLDNTFLTVDSRAPFIAAAQAAGVPIECHWMQTSFEDCTVNACHRMFDRYGTVFMDAAAIKAHPQAKSDPNIFPLAALFAARKRLNGVRKKGVWEVPHGKPRESEGFSKIVKVPFTRRPPNGTNKAIILDYDGTLRADAKLHGGEFHYPVKPAEVKLLPHRHKTLSKYRDDGYMLLGVTTQSGIGKGVVTEDMAVRLIRMTAALIGVQGMGETLYCPHYNFPVSCYCRKPQVGLGVLLTRRYHLNPSQCIYVGDMKTDQTFADRCGFQFAWAKDFFQGAV